MLKEITCYWWHQLFHYCDSMPFHSCVVELILIPKPTYFWKGLLCPECQMRLMILSSCMLVLLWWHYVVQLLLWDSHVFTGEKKEERKKIRETKKEKKNIVIHFVCLCIRFFSVQIRLQEFNHQVQQTAERNGLKYSCKNFICKNIFSIWGGTQIRKFASSLNCFQLQLISSGRIIPRHSTQSTLLNGYTLWV